jgi:glucose-6-phosphate 1-epimerase
VTLDFGLSDDLLDSKAKSAWNHPFGLTYSVTLSSGELQTTLTVSNTGDSPWEFQTLFHTYLAVNVSASPLSQKKKKKREKEKKNPPRQSLLFGAVADEAGGQDISKVSIHGLEETLYLDKVKDGGASTRAAAEAPVTFTGETDRVYLQAEKDITVSEGGKTLYEIKRDSLGDCVVWNPWVEKSKGMSDFAPADGYKHMVCVEAGAVGSWSKLEGGESWEGSQWIKSLL